MPAPSSSGSLLQDLVGPRPWPGLAWLWVVLFALGCSPEGASGTAIAVIPKGTQHEFWKAMHEGALEEAQRQGLAIRWKGPDPEGDRQAQIHLLQNFVQSGVAAIVLAPVDEQALQRPVQDAVRAGVPVVVVDSGLAGDAHSAFIATDNREGGAMAARRLRDLMGGKGKVLMLRFAQGSASTTQREEGFLASIGDGIEVVSSSQYAGDEQKARAAAAALLLSYPDIDGVFCPNESTTHGFLVALQQAGMAGKVRFVGFDSSEPLCKGLEQGHIDGLVLQDPRAMGRQGVAAAAAALRGAPVEALQRTQLAMATKDNLADPGIAALLRPDLSLQLR